MKKKSVGILLAIVAVSVFTGCNQSKAVKVPQPVREYWMDFNLLENKVGYMHVIQEDAVFRDQAATAMKAEMYMKMNRPDVNIENYTVDNYYLDAAKKPLGFFLMRKVTGMRDKTIEGAVEGSTLNLAVNDGYQVKEFTLDVPGDFNYDDIVLDQLRLAGFKPGDKVGYSVFNETDMKFVPCTKEVLRKDGDLIQLSTTLEASTPITLTESVMPDGTVEKIEFNGMGITFARTTREKAEADYPGLVMASSVVKVDKWLKDPQLIRKIGLKVVTDGNDAQKLFVSDEMQKIETMGQDTILVSESVIATKMDNLALPLDEGLKKKLALYLEPTNLIQSDDPQVRDKASELEGTENEVWKLSMRISELVRKLLLPSYDLVFASAVEALDKGRGDCSEYAVVFAALARSLGIPAKVCFGMVNTGSDTFLFHAWNEVYAGRWIPIDAALHQDKVDATHLALYKGPGNDILDVGLKILKALGLLRFEVLETVYENGK